MVLANTFTSTYAAGTQYTVHGSGTTNPSKCFWLVMGQLEDQARDSVKLSYRAVGSSTGIAESLGADNNFVPYNDFGSGDIPYPKDKYDSLIASGAEMMHLPFALGAISIFHSIPNVPMGSGGLNMTGCLLSRIFTREILTWDHPDIIEENKGLAALLPSKDYPITIAHRKNGSSSTASVTAYLRDSCPSKWPADKVGAKVDWPPASERILECQGSGAMTTCIRDNPGTIGYIDSGHGHGEGLTEIELKNKDGTTLSSKEAAAKGGIASAATNTDLPASYKDDFSAINYLNKAGTYTWPITAMSYVYVRGNLDHIDSPEEQGLLIAFLKSLYDETTFSQCLQFGFTAAPPSVAAQALASIETIITSNATQEWIFEGDNVLKVPVGIGQGPFVLSRKRRSRSEYLTTELLGGAEDSAMVLEGLQTNYALWKDENIALKVETADLRKELAQLKAAVALVSNDDTVQRVEESPGNGNEFTDNHEKELTASLVLSALSFTLWAVVLIGFVAKKIMNI